MPPRQALLASSLDYRYGRDRCSTSSHFDCRHRSRSTKSPKVLLLRPRFSAAITKTAFLEHGVIGVMGMAAMPSVVLIAYISRAYAVLRNENHHLSCHTTLCRVPLVDQPSMKNLDVGVFALKFPKIDSLRTTAISVYRNVFLPFVSLTGRVLISAPLIYGWGSKQSAIFGKKIVCSPPAV